MENLELKDIAHHLYGCEFELYSKTITGELFFERIGNLIEVKRKSTNHHPLVFECDDNIGSIIELAYDYTEAIPLLRKISDLTDDECIELCKLHFWATPYKVEYEVFKNAFGKKVVSWGDSPKDKYLIEREYSVNETYNQFQTIFLLSIGVDCLDLISKGIAKHQKSLELLN